jgi:adenine-specific DNA-methyltransferase
VFYSSYGDKDENNRESGNYSLLLDTVFGKENWTDQLIVTKSENGMGSRDGFATNHEYLFCYNKKSDAPSSAFHGLTPTAQYIASFNKSDKFGQYKVDGILRKKGDGAKREDSPNCYYPIYYNSETGACLLEPSKGSREALPKLPSGGDGRWTWSKDFAKDKLHKLHAGPDGTIYVKDYLESDRRQKPKSILRAAGYLTDSATNEIKEFFGNKAFPTPKPLQLIKDIVENAAPSNSVVLDFFGGSGVLGHAVINLNREDNGQRRYILVEMGEYFETVLVPRLKKVVYSTEWKEGKPSRRDTGVSHAFKIVKLESYEDTINNLRLPARTAEQTLALDGATPEARADYLLRYSLELETKGSPSLLDLQQFASPWSYQLSIHRQGETRPVTVDLVETFNWLLGLRVEHLDAPVTLTAEFESAAGGRLVVKKAGLRKAKAGWTFQTVTGRDRAGRLHLVLWRSLTGDTAQDNAVLDAFFQKQGFNARDTEFDTIYVNGDNNLANLAQVADTPEAPSAYKVKLIETEFHRLMWDVRDV